MNSKIWLWTAGWAVFYSLGEYFSKKWSIASDKTANLWYAWAAYFCCVGFWFPALKYRGSLTVLGCLYAALAALLTIAIGRLVFAETVALRHWIGIGLALAAVFLLGD